MDKDLKEKNRTVMLEKNKFDLKSQFNWIDRESLPDSNGFKFELYLKEDQNEYIDLISTFYHLFSLYLDEIIISPMPKNAIWGCFSENVWGWNFIDNCYEAQTDDISLLTKEYLSILEESNIEPTYSGCCKCNDWDAFLKVFIPCILEGYAWYSHLFFVPSINLFFYFDISCSLGIYFKEFNLEVLDLFEIIKTNDKYRVENVSDDIILEYIKNNDNN